MEGFLDVTWSGDRIVWENLLRHYLTCLDGAFTFARFGDGSEAGSFWRQVFVVNEDGLYGRFPRLEGLHLTAHDFFFGETAVGELIKELVGRESPIRRAELAMYLALLHPFALLAARVAHWKNGLLEAFDPDLERAAAVKQVSEAAALARHVTNLPKAFREDAFLSTVMDKNLLTWGQASLLHRDSRPEGANSAPLVVNPYEFAEGYVNQLERLLYRDWYVACFMENCKSSAIWASYGSNHTGVCLRFTTEEEQGKHSLHLNLVSGVGANGPLRREQLQPLSKVKYSKNIEPIDFFTSIGVLPVGSLNKYWYTGRDGQRSICAQMIDGNDASWRESYWRNFQLRTTRKFEDWKQETEHRIVFSSSVQDVSAPEMRKATYRFEDLDGIIFGIRTSMEDKLKIYSIIKEKCIATGRQDFSFYQAAYSPIKGEIEYHPLQLLKIRQI